MTDRNETEARCLDCDHGWECRECLRENQFGNVQISDCKIAVRCLICDEYQEISQKEAESIHILVCNECKWAMGMLKAMLRERGITY